MWDTTVCAYIEYVSNHRTMGIVGQSYPETLGNVAEIRGILGVPKMTHTHIVSFIARSDKNYRLK